MTVNNISAYSSVSETIDAFNYNNIDDLKNKKKELKALFEGEFATMGANSNEAQTIAKEIEEVQDLIAREENNVKKWNRIILEAQNEIGDTEYQLERVMAKYLAENEAKVQEAQDSIQKVTRDVMDLYAMGGIEKDKVADEIAKRVGDIAPNCNFPQSKIDGLSQHINDNVQKVTDAIDKRNMANTKLSTSCAALQLLNEMYQIQIMALGTQVYEKSGKKPVYTPEKQALVDKFYAQYHATATAGVDQFSISNVQVRNIASAIGCGTSTATTDTGAYTLFPENNTADMPASERTNLYPGSMLQEMFNAGFTFKEAMYACQYIFGTSNALLSYNLSTDSLTLAWGHMAANSGVSYADCDARTILNSFNNQARALWGRDRSGSESVPTTPTVPTPTDPTPPTTIVRDDPIGWSEGNVTFDFVIDRNGDKKFNDSSEFLGAGGRGINELMELDKDHNGIIEGDELEGLMLLRTDHEIQGFGFLTAKDAGIEKIDLSTIQNVSSEHSNVNDNVLKATFGITFNDGKTKTGYQSVDDVNYLNAVYGARYGEEMISKIDFNKDANKKAIDDIENFRNSYNDQTLAETLAQRDSVMASYRTQKAKVEEEVTAQNRELVQDLNRTAREAEFETDIIDEKNNREADEEEYAKHNLEGRMTALENRKSTIETELRNLYNEDQATHAQRISSLEADLASVDQQIDQLKQQLGITDAAA